MKKITLRSFFIWNFFILVVSFLSFRYLLERLLQPTIGMGWAYVIDQLVPLFVAFGASWYVIKKRIGFKHLKETFLQHKMQLILLVFVAFMAHILTLSYFFWSDEVIWMLKPITQNTPFFFHGDTLKGYFVTSYALLYLLFGKDVPWVYPFFSVLSFAISVCLAYWFLFVLTKKKLIAFFSALIFATTPAFLDMFTWHSTAHAPVLSMALVSLICLVFFQRNRRNFFYFLSLLFFFSAIKIGFIRIAGFTFIPVFLLLFPIPIEKFKLFSRKEIMFYAIPYIAIASYFVFFDFMALEIATFASALVKTHGNFFSAISIFLHYREVSSNSAAFFPKLYVFTSYLFVPSGLGGLVYRPIKTLLANSFGPHAIERLSITIWLGKGLILGLTTAGVIAFFRRKTLSMWLIVFSIFFLLSNMLHSVLGYQGVEFHATQPLFPSNLDNKFINEHLGYGPGSRYLYISSLGVGLLLATIGCTFLLSKGMKKLLGIFFFTILIVVNTFFNIKAQWQNMYSMTAYKSLILHLFKMIPKDGKSKLIYAINPQKNDLDTKFSGWHWLQGFYKLDEVTYTKDPKELVELIQSGKFKPEDFYAFYTNAQTLSFADISEQARKEFFSHASPSTPLAIPFKEKEISSSFEEIPLIGAPHKFHRALTMSDDLDLRFLSAQKLRIRAAVNILPSIYYPFSDVIYPPGTPGMMDSSLAVPMHIWKTIPMGPQVITKKDSQFWTATIPSLGDSMQNLSLQEKLALLTLVANRRHLVAGTIITGSDQKDDSQVSLDGLTDGLYTSLPVPYKAEHFYEADTTPTTITFKFPYPIRLGRVLLNIPPNFVNLHMPTKITVSGLLYGASQNVGTMAQDSILEWSPNGGKMIRIRLKPVLADTLTLQIEATKGLPIVADEIIVDDIDALIYRSEQVHQFIQNLPVYIDKPEIVSMMSSMDRFDRLSIAYACAEKEDWRKQQEASHRAVPDVWQQVTLTFIPDGKTRDMEIPLDCRGSVLRKVLMIGPRYPITMHIDSVVLQQEEGVK